MQVHGLHLTAAIVPNRHVRLAPPKHIFVMLISLKWTTRDTLP